jgi:peptidyl-prolyl cis-trans isomerase SurA
MRLISLLFLFFTAVYSLQAQKDYLIKLNNQNIEAEEFKRLFLKNRMEKKPVTEQEIDEYLELFSLFKMKVFYAQELGMDTLSAFKNELASYRSQLTKPYFSNNKVIDELVAEAYERLKFEINAAHILIKVDPNAPPADTLRAYEKAMRIRDKYKAGTSFDNLAKSFSDDPSASQNGGDLGYFTAFQMVYPFESAAYKLKLNELSKPVRSQYGYHIIKVIDKRSARGTIKVAHIMKLTPQKASILQKQEAKNTIDSIYLLLKQNQDFASLAQEFSDDHSSGSKGGELPWFSSGRMIKEFEDQAYALNKPGAFSEPFKTNFGWHIVKLIDKKDLPPFEEMKEELYARVKRDERSNLSKSTVIEKLKKDYQFTVYHKLAIFEANVDTTVASGSWTSENIPEKESLMFKFLDYSYTVGDFALFLELNQPRKQYSKSAINPYIYHQFQLFIEQKLFDYEDSQLETKYPDFAFLMKEYHDGILLFNISEDMVWNKAAKDSVGLRKFYEQNKQLYTTNAKVDLSSFNYSWPKLPAKWGKIEKNFDFSADIPDSVILLITQLYDSAIELDSNALFDVSSDYFKSLSFSNNELSAPGRFIMSKTKQQFYYVHKYIPEKSQKFEEIRGLLMSEYHKKLEDEWIKKLKQKYVLQINQEIYLSVKEELLTSINK